MAAWECPPLSSLQSTLAEPDAPIAKRMRAAYFLRQIYDDHARNNNNNFERSGEIEEKKTEPDEDEPLAVINTLARSLEDERHGDLLRHEFAYVLGQLRDERAVFVLERTLQNSEANTMVRHECAEALGAIGSARSVPVLEKCGRDDSVEVGETCRLALEYLRWKKNGGRDGEEDSPIACACMISPYSSVDPAPPHPKHAKLTAEEIGSILLDESAPLFERFRAMFSLRNRGDEECVEQLGNALINDDSSALLRHEVAYILGQMQHPGAVAYLETSLKRRDENGMVRHESAEALGAIEERWGEVSAILRQFLDDEDDVVRESCIVALDAADYWGYSDETETNFSLHKAESNGRNGVLHNHFNCV